MELRKILLAGVATTVMAGYAVAQGTSQPATQPSAVPGAAEPATPGATRGASTQSDATANEPLFSNYKGADVVDGEKNSISSIADVLIDDSGQAKHFVLSEGGVLGVGSTYRTFEISSLPALADGDVQLSLTKESLAALPEYVYPTASRTAGTPATGTSPMADRTAQAPAAGAPGAAATTEGRAAADVSPDVAALWPVSAIIGTELQAPEGEAASATSVADFRFSSDGKVDQVILNKGDVMGVGGEDQSVAFNELSFSGTPDDPVIAMTGGAGATGGSKSETERAPAPTAPTAPMAPAR